MLPALQSVISNAPGRQATCRILKCHTKLAGRPIARARHMPKSCKCNCRSSANEETWAQRGCMCKHPFASWSRLVGWSVHGRWTRSRYSKHFCYSSWFVLVLKNMLWQRLSDQHRCASTECITGPQLQRKELPV